MEAVIKIIEENIPEVIPLLMMYTLNKVRHYCCGEHVASLHRNVLKLVHSHASHCLLPAKLLELEQQPHPQTG